MGVPLFSSFASGLRLFWASKRLKWLTGVFVLGLLWMTFLGSYGAYLKATDPSSGPTVLAITVLTGGFWSVFFLLTMLLALLGVQGLIASDTSYFRSFLILIPWSLISELCLLVFLFRLLSVFLLLVFGVAFFGWIVFQAYFATRTGLQYAIKVDTLSLSKSVKAFALLSSALCYATVIGAFYIVVFILNPGVLGEQVRVFSLVLGAFLAIVFNTINTLLMVRHRNKPTLHNVVLIGLFVSLYTSYFIYSAGKATEVGLDLIGMSISVFFVIYTMSAVGSALSKRSQIETRWKLSAEAAATTTYFLTSGYYFASTFFSVLIQDPSVGAAIGDMIKLLIFPFVALVTELYYLRHMLRTSESRPIPEENKNEPISD